MDIRSIRILLKAVETGNLRETADYFHISRPAVSKTISELEKETGLKLLTRSSTGVYMTDASQMLLESMKEADEAFTKLEQQIREMNNNSNVIRIGCTFGISDWLHDKADAFQKRHPDAEIQFNECFNDSFPAMLDENKADIGLSSIVFSHLKHTKIVPVFMVPILWGVSADSPAAKRGWITKEELRSMTRLIVSSGIQIDSTSDTVYDTVADGKLVRADTAHQYYQCSSLMTLFQMVREGKGVLPLPQSDRPLHVDGISFLSCPDHKPWYIIYGYFPQGGLTGERKLFVDEVLNGGKDCLEEYRKRHP